MLLSNVVNNQMKANNTMWSHMPACFSNVSPNEHAWDMSDDIFQCLRECHSVSIKDQPTKTGLILVIYCTEDYSMLQRLLVKNNVSIVIISKDGT